MWLAVAAKKLGIKKVVVVSPYTSLVALAFVPPRFPVVLKYS
jgi:hypothetical protein